MSSASSLIIISDAADVVVKDLSHHSADNPYMAVIGLSSIHMSLTAADSLIEQLMDKIWARNPTAAAEIVDRLITHMDGDVA